MGPEEVLKPGIVLATYALAYVAAKRVTDSGWFDFLSERSGRCGGVDGLRGYLALAVFFHHFAITWHWKSSGQWGLPSERYLQNFGKVGVSLFFMISGFLFISKILRGPDAVNWPRLFESRFFRIVPLYLFSVLVISLLAFAGSGYGAVEPAGDIVREHIKWLAFHGDAINGFRDTKLINAGVDWSLRYEWLFYLSLPIVALIVKGGRVFAWALTLGGLALALYPIKLFGVTFFYFSLFAIGGIAAKLWVDGKIDEGLLKGPLVSILAGVALLLAVVHPDTLSPTQVLLMAMFFIPVALGNDLFGLLSTRPSQALGEISYSIYLLHGIVLYLVFSTPELVEARRFAFIEYLALMPAVAVLVLGISVCTYLAIEAPAMRYGRRYPVSRHAGALAGWTMTTLLRWVKA